VEEAVTEADRWIDQLGSRDAVQRNIAESALLAMGDEAGAAIRKRTARVEQTRMFRILVPFNLSLALSAGLSMAIAVGIGRLFHLPDIGIVVLMMPLAVAGICLAAIYAGPRILFPPSERQFIRFVARSDDVHMVPYLLVAGMGSMTRDLGIEDALIRLLPKVRPG
jgi:hypothetical protein